MKHKIALLAFAVAGLAAQPAFAKTAPAAQGHPALFETGKSTLQEVEKALGEPNRSKDNAGPKTVCYQYTRRPDRPESSFIPIIGGVVPNTGLTCCFRFGADGVLTKIEPEGAQGQAAACPPPLLHLPFAGDH